MFKNFIYKRLLKSIRDYSKIDGWLTDNEAVGLYGIARQMPKKAVVVEIGSWQGKSTFCISKGLKSGKLYAIDPFNADAGLDVDSQEAYLKKGAIDLLESFEKNMAKYGTKQNIIVRKGYSQQFHEDFNQIDFLFIDGDHSVEGCRSDFEMYSPKISSGGFIAFHDYYEDRENLGPTYVIKNLILTSKAFKFVALYDSLWIAKKL